VRVQLQPSNTIMPNKLGYGSGMLDDTPIHLDLRNIKLSHSYLLWDVKARRNHASSLSWTQSVSTKVETLPSANTSRIWLWRLLLDVRPKRASGFCYTTSDCSYMEIEDCNLPWTHFPAHRLATKIVLLPGPTAVNVEPHRQRQSFEKRHGECRGVHTWNIASILQSVKQASLVLTTRIGIRLGTLLIETSLSGSTTRASTSMSLSGRQYRFRSRSRRKWC